MGRAFAEALARKGADVVVHHHSSASLAEAEETARLVREQEVRALIVEGDLVEPAVVRRMFEETLTSFGRVDIVINTAGVVVKKPFVDITEEEFDRCFGTNAKAAFFTMQEAARHISDGGRIINMGTTILGATLPNYSVYAGSKAPLEDFTRSLAKEIGPRGVTVNTVAPGPVDDSFYRHAETEEAATRAATQSGLGRLGRIDDVVPVIEFLVSPGSQWTTAQTVFVNGGYLAR